MRPIMIADVALPAPGWISHVGGIGWLATHPADRSVTVLDPELRTVARVEVPVAAQGFEASVSERHLAAVTLDELVVCDRRGRVRWRRKQDVPRAGLPCRPSCHLDAQGVLWVYRPAGDELAAYDAATGEEIDRTRLDSSVGAASFWPHPDRRRLGLHVAMGQDTPLSHLACLVDGRIDGRNLPGEQIPGYRDGDYRLMEAAALVSDDFVLVAVGTDDLDGDFEDHLMLSTRSLRWQADIDYGHCLTQNAIAATDGQGHWITRGQDAVLRLWQLPDSISDEVPGQLQLW